ncbi:MAG: hypothetical protein IPK93_02670 [Solirubrobacterales bacterium]|nr:hypothetical protein [Solirubrobacterales bacterium]
MLHKETPAPKHECSCGLYAFHAWPEHFGRSLLGPATLEYPQVFGVVEAWGRTELHNDGFRAEFARPLALLVPCQEIPSIERARLEQLAELYRVRLIEPSQGDSLEEFIGGLGPALDRDLVADLVPAEPESILDTPVPPFIPNIPVSPPAPPPRWWMRWILQPLFELICMVLGLIAMAIYVGGAILLALIAISAAILAISFTLLFLVAGVIRLFS